jgi:hypothetical protein
MRKVYILFFSLLFVAGATFAQKVNVDVAKGTPEIDGIEEELWDAVDPVPFVLNYDSETPTVTAYWKALWDADNLYFILNVEDDDHYPAWEVSATAANWEYDKPELYFDVNDVLVDGVGPATASSGHYQFAPGFLEDGYDVVHEDMGTTQAPHGVYCYVLTGESYVFEYAIEIASMSNKDAVPMDCETIQALPEKIGFDATVIDQDEGVTTARQRTVWQQGGQGTPSDGTEAWNSMDASGTITMIGDCQGSGIKDVKTVNIAVQPNPVTDFMTINADFDKVVINNILGQEISTMNQIKSNKLDVGYLSKGVYIIKVYKGERFIGAAKITKN